MNGHIIIIDKPTGVTSRFVVDKVGKLLGTKKVGHTGTLDPLATGVLILCVNRATKLVDYLTALDKTYQVEMQLGISTDTLDITGQVLQEATVNVDENTIKNAIMSFQKTYVQQVPLYSAVKVNGKKCYEYARNNEPVVLPEKEVTVYNISNIVINQNLVSFTCSVSKGTYIRSLINDIATELNTIATMTNLRRTKQGNFDIKEACTIDDLKLIEVENLFLNYPVFEYDNLDLIKNGNKINIDLETDYVRIYHQGTCIAIYQKINEREYKPLVFGQEFK